MMMPILEGLDGINKMSKSLGNYIGVNDQPKEMYGKIMSIPDNLIIRYYRLLTDLNNNELGEIQEKLADDSVNPMEIKKQLAWTIVCQYHDQDAAKQSAAEFKRVFSQGRVPDEIPQIEIKKDTLQDGRIRIVTLIGATELLSSNSEIRRMIKQGAVAINGQKHNSITEEIEVVDGMVIQIGKRRFARIKLNK